MMRFLRDIIPVLRGRDDLGEKFHMESDSSEATRECVARFARDNIALQNGAYVTTDELERERQVLARHSI